jgi:BirA family biotin operon repressor/biotin-[acetyl-CoA-carboxylase] ligase
MSITDAITADDITRRFEASVIGKKAFCYHTISSTNEISHKLAKGGAFDGTVVTADQQTRGKGRGGNQWLSNAGENIMLSVILRPTCKPDDLNLMTIFSAIAVAEVVAKTLGKTPEIKWPNDVLFDGRKISGILLESSISNASVEYVIIGIGLNVNQKEFPPDISATSLKLEANRPFTRIGVLTDLLKALEVRYAQFQAGQAQLIVNDFKRLCTIFGKRLTFTYKGIPHNGVALDLDASGMMETRLGNLTKKISAAEMTNVKY